MTKADIPKSRTSPLSTKYGEIVHSDVWGPAAFRAIHGYQYYITFTDDFSRETIITLSKSKDEAFQSYKNYEAWVKTHRNANIKSLQSDRGGEYLSGEFNSHLKEQGTTRRLTAPNTPSSNGVAERKNRTIVERTRAILFQAGNPPKSLWAEAMRHVVWLMNRTGSRTLQGRTPFEMARGTVPAMTNVREWYSEIWVHTPEAGKLEKRAIKGHFIGYDNETKGYRVYWPGTHRVSVERNITFAEPAHPVSDETEEAPPDSPQRTNAPLPTTNPNTPLTKPTAPSSPTPSPPERPKRQTKPSVKVKELLTGEGTTGDPSQTIPKGVQIAPTNLNLSITEESANIAFALGTIETADPRTISEAMKRLEWPEWKQAVERELEQFEKMGTWTLIERPADTNVVGSRWVLHTKTDADGTMITKRKARLVAQGFTQTYGLDYAETFAPTARPASTRSLLALAAKMDWEIQQIDVRGAYLNGELNEDVYMAQPPFFAVPGKEHLVCKLHKALYGLKQVGRQWHEKLSSVLLSMGFAKCAADHAVFYRSKGTELFFIPTHVDDLTLISPSKHTIDSFKETFTRHLEISDLGEVHWLLGIQVNRDRALKSISLSQTAYIDSITTRFDSIPYSMTHNHNIAVKCMTITVYGMVNSPS
jgi:hypothetical protein